MLLNRKFDFEFRKSEDFKDDYLSFVDLKQIQKVENEFNLEEYQRLDRIRVLDYDHLKYLKHDTKTIRLFKLSHQHENELAMYEINMTNNICKIGKKFFFFNSKIGNVYSTNNSFFSNFNDGLFTIIFKENYFSLFQYFDDGCIKRLFSFISKGMIYDTKLKNYMLKYDNKPIIYNESNNNLLVFDYKNLEFCRIDFLKGKTIKKKNNAQIINFDWKYNFNTEFLFFDSNNIYLSDFRQNKHCYSLYDNKKFKKVQYHSNSNFLIVLDNQSLKLIDIRYPKILNTIFEKKINCNYIKILKTNYFKNKVAIYDNSNKLHLIDISNPKISKEKTIDLANLSTKSEIYWDICEEIETLNIFEFKNNFQNLSFRSIPFN